MSNSRCGTVWHQTYSGMGGHKALHSTPAPTSEGHEVGHEHFVDDVNDAVISAYVGPCDGRTADLNAFQQGGCDCVFHEVAVGI